MSTPAPQDGLDVVVNADGGVTVSADELARLGVRPGAHLKLVPQQKSRKGKSLKGALAGTVPPEVIDDFIQGLDESKAERRAFYGAMQ
jgi:hypothetical protein